MRMSIRSTHYGKIKKAFLLHPRSARICLLESYKYSSIELAASKVVGHGILLVGDIGYPVAGVDVVDV